MITFYHGSSSAALMMNCLKVTAVHSTMDMSVANTTEASGFYPFREIGKMIADDVSLMSCCPPWRVEAVSEDEVVLSWMGKRYAVAVGETVDTQEYALENPYLSWDGILLNIRYERCDVWERVLSAFDGGRREECLKLLYELILEGEGGLRPIYAWLSASQNWNTLIISDYQQFSESIGDLTSVDGSDLEAWMENFAQILGVNRLDALSDSVQGLEHFLKQKAETNDRALEILSGEIKCRSLTERENPDSNELLLQLKMVDTSDEENVKLNYRYLTKELLNAGQKIMMGEFGEVEIAEVADDSVKVVWLGEELCISHDHLVHVLDSNPEEVADMDYTLGYTPQRYLRGEIVVGNLWHQVKNLISKVGFMTKFPDMPADMPADAEIEQYKEVTKSLVKVLIERGDAELQPLYDMLCDTEDWSE